MTTTFDRLMAEGYKVASIGNVYASKWYDPNGLYLGVCVRMPEYEDQDYFVSSHLSNEVTTIHGFENAINWLVAQSVPLHPAGD